jgi:hypothetical protein
MTACPVNIAGSYGYRRLQKVARQHGNLLEHCTGLTFSSVPHRRFEREMLLRTNHYLPRLPGFTKEIDVTYIAAMLTVIGYSINDAVVVSDRLR